MKTEAELQANLKDLDLMVKQYAEATKTFIALKTSTSRNDNKAAEIVAQSKILQNLQNNIQSLSGTIKRETLILNPVLERNKRTISANNSSLIQTNYSFLNQYEKLERKVLEYNEILGEFQSTTLQQNTAKFKYMLYFFLAFLCFVLIIHALTTKELQYLALHIGVIVFCVVLLLYNVYEQIYALLKRGAITSFSLVQNFLEMK
jgi:hypothetical protein